MPRKSTRRAPPRSSSRNPRAESAKSRERREAVERLKEWGIKPGDVIYTTVRHVAPSGMSRTIDLYKFESCDRHGEVRFVLLSGNVARATGLALAKDRFGSDNGVKIGGAGMDMGAHLVEALSHAMFGSDRALRQKWL